MYIRLFAVMIIEEAIKQETFQSMQQKAIINLMYSASWMSGQMRSALEPYSISWQQYNIMRILRGQKGKPASIKLLTERMIDKTSNTSRLIDKMVTKKIVERIACPKDRRQVDIRLTQAGEALLENATASMNEQLDLNLGHISETEFGQLNDHLDQLRNKE